MANTKVKHLSPLQLSIAETSLLLVKKTGSFFQALRDTRHTIEQRRYARLERRRAADLARFQAMTPGERRRYIEKYVREEHLLKDIGVIPE